MSRLSGSPTGPCRVPRNWQFRSLRPRPDRLSGEVLQLVLRLAREQVDQAALDALALEQRVVDLLAIGISTP